MSLQQKRGRKLHEPKIEVYNDILFVNNILTDASIFQSQLVL